jgi:ribokinase
MTQSADIVVLGSINTDLVIRGKRLPRPGETVLGGRFFRAAGGKGANQAVAAARAGNGRVAFIGAVGDDAFGQQALNGLKAEGIDCQFVKVVSQQPSGVALILVDQHGENLISVAGGANDCLEPTDVAAISDEVFRHAKVFLACLESPLPAVAAGLRRAKDAHLTTILNPAPANKSVVEQGLLPLVDVLSPNRGEAAVLTGLDTCDPAILPAAARDLQARGCRSVIVTLGEDGCLVVGEQQLAVPSYRVRALDATAAGDTFTGALAVALAEGKSLEAAARWANAAAAISVTRLGAQASIPRRAEIDDFPAA